MAYLSALKKTKKNTIPLLTADIETDKDGHLIDIGYYDGVEFTCFQSWIDFIDFLPFGACVWFHNGGRFDAVNAVSKLSPTLNWEASLAGSSIVRIEFKEKKIIFLDSMCILMSGLDKLSKTFNVADKKIDVDNKYKSDMGLYKSLYEGEYFEYLKNDCKSLYQILEKFNSLLTEKFGILHLPITIASTALTIWRKNFLDTDIYIPTVKQDEFLRKGYFGGRVEYCGYGEITNGLYHDCTMIDVNSMYPHAMLGDFPIGEIYFSKKFEFVVSRNKGKIPYGMFRCSFSIPDTFRHSPFISSVSKNGFTFGHSSDDTYLTHEDLLLIQEMGGSFEVSEFYYCIEVAPIFKKYVDELGKLKSESIDPALVLIAKFLLNSLYGKLGQKNTREVVINLSAENPEVFEKLVHKYNEKHKAGILDFFELDYSDYFNNAKILSENYDNVILSYEVETKSAQKISNPLIAAYVTARARRKLWQAMETHETIYVDTDSLLTQSEIKVSVSKKLGDWGIESCHYTTGDFKKVIADVRGKKTYTIFDEDMNNLKSKSKGFKSFNLPEKSLIEKEFFSGTNTNPTGFKTWCRNNHINPSKFNKVERVNSRQLPTKTKSENPDFFVSYNESILEKRKKINKNKIPSPQ